MPGKWISRPGPGAGGSGGTGRWINGPTYTALSGIAPRSTRIPGTGSLVLTGLAPSIKPLATVVTPGTGVLVLIALRPASFAQNSFRTSIVTWNTPTSLWGLQPTPDTVHSDSNGANWTTAGGVIDDLNAAGAQCWAKFYGGNNTCKNPDGTFSTSLWISAFDSWVAEVASIAGGTAKMRTAVRTGAVRALSVLDDFTTGATQPSNAYLHAVTYNEIQVICNHAKGVWPWMPLIARGPNSYLKTAAASFAGGGGPGVKYSSLDAGVGQMRTISDGTPTSYVSNQIAAGLSVGLGCIGSLNILNRGTGTTPGWGCQPGDTPGDCGASPTEIRNVGFAWLNRPESAGFLMWAYDGGGALGHTYWDKPAIQQAMQDVYDASVGRQDGPVNVRGDLVAA